MIKSSLRELFYWFNNAFNPQENQILTMTVQHDKMFF